MMIERLEKHIRYTFKDKKILNQALTHRSANVEHNERLEFLGDAILNFVIADELFKRFPFVDEGNLSRMRAALVCGKALADIGKAFNLGNYLKLGQGELKSGGYRRESIIADSVEAIIGAVYLDDGIDSTKNLLLNWYAESLKTIEPGERQKDPKTRLQEYLQGLHKPLPVYLVTQIRGHAHEQIFTVQCRIEGEEECFLGEGSSRRKAEQIAAERAIENLDIK